MIASLTAKFLTNHFLVLSNVSPGLNLVSKNFLPKNSPLVNWLASLPKTSLIVSKLPLNKLPKFWFSGGKFLSVFCTFSVFQNLLVAASSIQGSGIPPLENSALSIGVNISSTVPPSIPTWPLISSTWSTTSPISDLIGAVPWPLVVLWF